MPLVVKNGNQMSILKNLHQIAVPVMETESMEEKKHKRNVKGHIIRTTIPEALDYQSKHHNISYN